MITDENTARLMITDETTLKELQEALDAVKLEVVKVTCSIVRSDALGWQVSLGSLPRTDRIGRGATLAEALRMALT